MRRPLRADAFDRAINLSAGLGLLINDRGLESEPGGGRCRGKSRGSGADDSEIERGAHGFAPTLPGWRLMRIFSATGTRHACWFGAPSISIRHSKHTPIMQ